jgi:hypothetical protein
MQAMGPGNGTNKGVGSRCCVLLWLRGAGIGHRLPGKGSGVVVASFCGFSHKTAKLRLPTPFFVLLFSISLITLHLVIPWEFGGVVVTTSGNVRTSAVGRIYAIIRWVVEWQQTFTLAVTDQAVVFPLKEITSLRGT